MTLVTLDSKTDDVMAAAHDPALPADVLRPVRGHHAFEACVEQLATLIRLGVYPRGSTLPPERELAGRLAWSRSLSYVSCSAWAFGWRVWILFGWSWRWR